MKLMHISDLHIGKKLFETSMLEDQRYILNRILDLLDDFLSALALHGVCTMIISGNHDSLERLAYARRFLYK